MNRSIEQALLSLLPTHNAALPDQVVELAGSLLAQSRHRASTLKADEEIARPYACAHLACERLKISLDLPQIEPRPPVPPRIYKRLYNHLDSILPHPSQTTPGRVKTPRSKPRELGSSPIKGFSPLKERSLTSLWKSPSSVRGNSSRAKPQSTSASFSPAPESGLPPWVRPCLRLLCKELDNTKIGPTVIAGMEAIAIPYGRWTKDEWVIENLSALLASLYLYVLSTVSMPGGVDEARYVAARKRVVDCMARARESIRVKDLGEDSLWEGWQAICAADIDNAALHINRHGWLDSDWAQGIDDLIMGDDDDQAVNEGKMDIDEYHSGQVPRADIMFQERYDYLSEAKRKEYALWKDGIMRRINNLQKRIDPMEVDS